MRVLSPFSRFFPGPPKTSPARREVSVRGLLLRLVLSCVLPGVIGAVVLFAVEYQRRDAQLQNGTLATARALVQSVDGQLQRAQAVANILGADRDLAAHDLPAFHRHAADALAQADIGAYVAVLDAGGRQLVNTLKPYGTPMPIHGNPRALREVFATGQDGVSDVFLCTLTRRAVVAIYRPVIQRGQVAFVLNVGLYASTLADIIDAEHLPSEWIVAIQDGSANLAAQSASPAGRPAPLPSPALRQALRESREGLLSARTLGGTPVLYAFSRSGLTHWSVAIAIPQAARQRDLARSLLPLGLGLLALFGLGMAMTRRISRHISEAVQGLSAPAMALATGAAVSMPRSDLGEANAVAAAIGRAASLLEERKELEKTLQDSERRLAMALQAGKAAVWEIDTASGKLIGAENLAVFLGYRPDEIATLADWLARIHPDLRNGLAQTLEALIAGRRNSYEYEYSIRSKHGGWHWFLCHGKVVGRDPLGYPRIIGSYTNIDERKHAEQALRDSEQRLALALAAGGSVEWEMDVASGVITGKDKLFAMYGYAAGELSTLADWAGLLHPEDSAGIPDRIAAAVEGRNDGFRFEARLRCKDGSWRWNLAQAVVAERDGAGRAVRLVGTHTDIDVRKRAETAIQRMNAELEQGIRERTAELERANEALLVSNLELQQFARAAAHDLQTPLRSIASFAELLQMEVRKYGDMQVDTWAGQVIDNARRLQALIQELLSYTRVETQGLPLEPVATDRLLAEVLHSLQEMIRHSGARIEVTRLPDLVADRRQLGQVLQNLIENAIKYNRAKPPEIRIACVARRGDWLFSVSDNGIGIDPRHHESIFEIFRRLHTYRQIPGTGIGLALCRRIVERHGGRIWVESRPGEGSTFHFTIPARHRQDA